MLINSSDLSGGKCNIKAYCSSTKVCLILSTGFRIFVLKFKIRPDSSDDGNFVWLIFFLTRKLFRVHICVHTCVPYCFCCFCEALKWQKKLLKSGYKYQRQSLVEYAAWYSIQTTETISADISSLLMSTNDPPTIYWWYLGTKLSDNALLVRQ